MAYRLGIDVGGTNTDAVVLDDKLKVIATTKAATSEDVMSGIENAMKTVLEQIGEDKSKISYAMLGTTQATNAIVERKHLNKVGVVRIGLPATEAIEPMCGWPEDLKAAIGNHSYLVHGGHEFDGREISTLKEDELYQAFEDMKGKVSSVAIISVFSPVNDAHELRAQEIAKEVLGEDIPVSLSSEIGSIGLIERENSTILNAALVEVAKKTVLGFKHALEHQNVLAKIYLGQNDGTLMNAEYAIKYPILTIACGPTNSIRGAAYLAGFEDALVVDVGGTTTDVGVLQKGFPRQSSLAVEIGGVRTNFRMPDLISLGLGGGTIVRGVEDDNAPNTVGPDSVGYKLSQEALIFGGDVLTTTDVVVALGHAQLGDASKTSHINKDKLEEVYQTMIEMTEDVIDRMKTSAQNVPVILVGGGSLLLPEELEGASEVSKPEHFEVANAIGSAIAQVSGEVEKLYSLENMTREEAVADAKELAIQDAKDAGAEPTSIEIVDIEDVPLAYLPGNVTRVHVKAAGNLRM